MKFAIDGVLCVPRKKMGHVVVAHLLCWCKMKNNKCMRYVGLIQINGVVYALAPFIWASSNLSYFYHAISCFSFTGSIFNSSGLLAIGVGGRRINRDAGIQLQFTCPRNEWRKHTLDTSDGCGVSAWPDAGMQFTLTYDAAPSVILQPQDKKLHAIAQLRPTAVRGQLSAQAWPSAPLAEV